MREYGTSFSIRVVLSPRSSRDILREGRKERSWGTERQENFEKNGGKEKE